MMYLKGSGITEGFEPLNQHDHILKQFCFSSVVTFCCLWIFLFCKKLVGALSPKKPFEPKKSFESLPDDVVIDILSRLPAEIVLECRTICKKWKALTSTQDFAVVHIKQAPLTIIARQLSYDCETYYFDEWGGRIREFRARSILPPWIHLSFILRNSYHGLLFLRLVDRSLKRSEQVNAARFIFYMICNPITREKLTLNTDGGVIYTIFFHSSAREYRVLWGRRKAGTSCIQYKILNLRSTQPSWRQLASNFSYRARLFECPVIVNEGLHWMIDEDLACMESIVMFNINTEEFSALPHPGDECNSSRRRHDHMHLFEMGVGRLSLGDCSVQEQIELWDLEDHANWVWVRRQRIILAFHVNPYPFNYRASDQFLRPLGVKNGELLLKVSLRGFFAYHLSRGTVRNVEVHGINDFIYYLGLGTQSLLSLGNFKSGSCINM